jgi:hypothetical protein
MNPQPTSLDVFFSVGERQISLAMDDPDIAAALLSLGFTRQHAADGQTQLLHVRHLHQLLNGQSPPIIDDPVFINTWEEAEACYSRSLAIARLAFRQDTQAIVALNLFQERLVTIAGWLMQTEHFYGHLCHNAAWAETMAGYGYGAEDLEAEAKLAKAVRNLAEEYPKTHGKHPHSTRQRDARLVELDAWLAEFRALCRIALAGEPRLLGAMGLGTPVLARG